MLTRMTMNVASTSKSVTGRDKLISGLPASVRRRSSSTISYDLILSEGSCGIGSSIRVVLVCNT